MGYTGRAVGHRRPDVLCCEVRIVFQQFTLARASASLRRISCTVIRVPRITGFPIMIAGLISIRWVIITILLFHHIAPTPSHNRGVCLGAHFKFTTSQFSCARL